MLSVKQHELKRLPTRLDGARTWVEEVASTQQDQAAHKSAQDSGTQAGRQHASAKDHDAFIVAAPQARRPAGLGHVLVTRSTREVRDGGEIVAGKEAEEEGEERGDEGHDQGLYL